MEKGTGKTIKIVLIGPESTGKTEMAEFLANKFNVEFVPEYAREYVEKLKRAYKYSDVEQIALKQVQLHEQYSLKSHKLLFYDTFLIITKVWFIQVYGRMPSWLDQKIKSIKIDLFLLCNTDLPWVADNVRENGGAMREKLFKIYKSELEHYGFCYEIVKGTGNERFVNALNIVNNFLEK